MSKEILAIQNSDAVKEYRFITQQIQSDFDTN